jgi:glyoxylase-like metal-dependent hydrolase (beta-lactamase superfamily II)
VRIAPGIHRIGDNSMINSYLVEEAGQVTIIDAGISGLYRDLPRELAAMGRSISDVRALVLTHGHSDHIGFAERLRTDRRVPVSVHEADAAMARGEVPNPAKGYGSTKLGPLAAFMWFSLLRGGLRTRHLHEVSTFGDGATLDVSGDPARDPDAGSHAGKCGAAPRISQHPHRRRRVRNVRGDDGRAGAGNRSVHR